MKRSKAAAVAIFLTAATSASANDTMLAKAVAVYNDLPAKARVLSLASITATPDARVTQLPAWLTQADLTKQEAAAVAAAFGVYGDGYRSNYQSRRWGTGAKVAGLVAETLLRPTAQLPDAMPNEAPARALTEARRTRLLGTMTAMATCSGALVRAAGKLTALRAADDATRLLIKARQDLGAAALPPDDSCLS